MLSWFVVAIFLPTIHPIGVPHYECGEHGRFEYCIDGIPGCVVGCHCHPGYYFDTESKICEPNAKLVHEYRRIYEPTEAIVTTPRDSHEADTEAAPTTTEQSILKEADELGDWLYNQFFKTVENQIINKTDKPEDKPTRRSGDSGPQLQLSRRRGRRKSRKRKGGLRKKLLRITEDDSLFDSDSDDSSSDSSGSSDDSDTSSSSDTSKESSPKRPDEPGGSHTKDDEKEHGHRKVVIFNKKPKPPLPSFIFLPNFETPFYPPIGLPPPPALPMYPMVPVPPMIPMMQPSTPACNNQSTTEAPTSMTPMTTTPKGPSNQTNDDPKDQENDEQRELDVNARMRKLRKMHMPPPHHRRNKHRESNVPWGDQLPANPGGPPINDVDFKYLSQLIHKSGPKAMKNQPTRRKFDELRTNEVINTRQLRDDEQQGYYSNLGQKIASLIRSADANRDQPTDTDAPNQISKSVPVNQNSVFQNQNSYSPHSYWERYVRSPLRQFRGDPPENYENYENLFNIESEVKTVAETEKPLSLGELENALVFMNNAKVELDNTIDDDDKDDENESEINGLNTTSNRSWNVNLLVPNRYNTYKVQKIVNNQSFQKSTAKPHIVSAPKPLSKLVTRNNTQTVEAYVNNYKNLQGILVENLKNIANNSGMENYTIISRSNVGNIPANTRASSFTRRYQHVEPTDHQGTFEYPKQKLSGIKVHKIHLKPMMKPNNEQYHQFKPLSGSPDTIYRDEYDFFLSKNEQPFVIQRIVTRSPPIVKGSYFPTSYFHQSNHHNSFFDK